MAVGARAAPAIGRELTAVFARERRASSLEIRSTSGLSLKWPDFLTSLGSGFTPGKTIRSRHG
jgi:hypothetical protein